jgi:hypothetical protein
MPIYTKRVNTKCVSRVNYFWTAPSLSTSIVLTRRTRCVYVGRHV